MNRVIFIFILLFTPKVFAITPAFQNALENIERQYQKQFEEQGLKGGVVLRVESPDHVSVAAVMIRDQAALFAVNEKWANDTRITSDEWQLILCHETGHLLGGAPFTWINQDEGGDYSAEGQADYFAASKCLRTLWWNHSENQKVVSRLDKNLVTRIQSQGCESAQCLRIVSTAINLMSVLSPEDTVDIRQRSPERVTDTKTQPVSNSSQCRLDTILAGAMCSIEPQIPFSRTNQRQGACIEGPGARPPCWFRTDDLDGVY